jgi:hypothetical protein
VLDSINEPLLSTHASEGIMSTLKGVFHRMTSEIFKTRRCKNERKNNQITITNHAKKQQYQTSCLRLCGVAASAKSHGFSMAVVATRPSLYGKGLACQGAGGGGRGAGLLCTCGGARAHCRQQLQQHKTELVVLPKMLSGSITKDVLVSFLVVLPKTSPGLNF